MLFNEIYMSIYAYVIICRVANQSVSFTLPCKGFCHEDFLIFVPFSLNFLGNKYSPDFMLVLHSLHFSKTYIFASLITSSLDLWLKLLFRICRSMFT